MDTHQVPVPAYSHVGNRQLPGWVWAAVHAAGRRADPGAIPVVVVSERAARELVLLDAADFHRLPWELPQARQAAGNERRIPSASRDGRTDGEL
jgi:hypothetical protein